MNMLKVLFTVWLLALGLCYAQVQPRNELLTQIHEFVKGNSLSHIIFVVDGSGSISSHDWGLMKQALSTMINTANSDSIKTSVVFFSNLVHVAIKELSPRADRQTITTTIQQYNQPSGSTNTLGALDEASRIIDRSPTTYTSTLVVLLTDGRPNENSTSSASNIKSKPNTRLICLGFGFTDENVLRQLASPNSVLVKDQLVKIVEELDNVISSSSAYEGLYLTTHVDELRGFSFSKPLEISVVLHNNALRTVPAGSHIYFNEVQSSAAAKLRQTHYHPARYIIPTEIPHGDLHTFPMELHTQADASVHTLPQYIQATFTDPHNHKVIFYVSLKSHIFSKDLVDTLRSSVSGTTQKWVNVLLAGPFANGKSLLHNLMISALSYKVSTKTISPTGNIGEHTTTETIYTDAQEHLHIKDLPLRIMDTMGIDGNFSVQFFEFLMQGAVPAGYVGTYVYGHLSARAKNCSTCEVNQAHAVIFVVAHDILNYNDDHRIVINLKRCIQTAKQQGYIPIPVITFMSRVSKEKKQDTMSSVLKKLKLSPPAFPLSYNNSYHGTRSERDFGVDLEVLSILHEVAERAPAKLPKKKKLLLEDTNLSQLRDIVLILLPSFVVILLVRWTYILLRHLVKTISRLIKASRSPIPPSHSPPLVHPHPQSNEHLHHHQQEEDPQQQEQPHQPQSQSQSQSQPQPLPAARLQFSVQRRTPSSQGVSSTSTQKEAVPASPDIDLTSEDPSVHPAREWFS